MYIPAHFSEDDLAVLHTLMRDYSFANLVSVGEDSVPFATPLPFVLEADPPSYGTLHAHMALGNPQWRTFQPEREVLVIFQGPHAYITPSWYEEALSVPTWNYATVHAYGYPHITTDHDELYALLKKLVTIHEASFATPWPFDLPTDYVDQRMRGVVGFSLEITRLEGKFKMSQNRNQNERIRVSAELSASQDPTRCEVAEMVSAQRRRISSQSS
jgi:transcriptional regulator